MEEDQGSVEGSSGDLSAAVESVAAEAPKLSGMDKLKAASEFVKKNDALPPKEGEKTAPAATVEKPVVKPVPGAPAPKPVIPSGTPEEQAAAAAAYKPDFKYKAQGKEFEVPEKFRALCTDKASEEEVKKVLGQAASYEEEKTNHAETKTKFQKTTENLGQMQGGISHLRGLAQKDRWDEWFQKLNIPAERIYKWVLDKVQYNQLPPEQRAQLDAQRNLELQNERATEQVSQVSAERLQLATQMKEMQLDLALGKAEAKTMADAFDARVGKPGAFKEAIINHGMSVWALSGNKTDLTPEQALADFVQKYGNPSAFAPTVPAAGAANPGADPAASAPSANAAPPVKVIPNVAGRSSSSPVKQGVRSIDDLRKRAKELEAQNPGQASQGYLAG